MIQLEIRSPLPLKIPRVKSPTGNYKRTINVASYRVTGNHYNIEFPSLTELEQFTSFFDDVRKRKGQCGVYSLRFLDANVWTEGTIVESAGGLNIQFDNLGNGGQWLGTYEEI